LGTDWFGLYYGFLGDDLGFGLLDLGLLLQLSFVLQAISLVQYLLFGFHDVEFGHFEDLFWFERIFNRLWLRSGFFRNLLVFLVLAHVLVE